MKTKTTRRGKGRGTRGKEGGENWDTMAKMTKRRGGGGGGTPIGIFPRYERWRGGRGVRRSAYLGR